MSYNIRKAAVIGSGTMGSGIAALLAGVGLKTLVLDIPPEDSQPGDPANKRNAIVEKNIKSLKSLQPPQLYSASVLDAIEIGNTEDDLEKVGDADWIIEAVVEKLDIKQNLMAKLAEIARPDAIITTNTSGLPIKSIAEGLGEDFTRRFMGTHFFNPPRYLHLLEVIPHENTDPDAVEFMVDFATHRLGKGVVIAKDEPNFIGNRFMTMSGMQTMNYTLDHDFTVEEVDALTGPLIGRPKTATFRLNDLVGFDVAVHVARNLYDAIPDDPAREILQHPQNTHIAEEMLERGWLGNKSGQGFYKAVRQEDGSKEYYHLNLETFEYKPPENPTFESVEKHKDVKPTGERIRRLINEDDRAGRFLWHIHAFYLAYASNRVPEITDTIVNIDNAQKWGFSHELGPFEIWDAIGVEGTISEFEDAGYPVADWVKKMVEDGNETFYQYNNNGLKTAYYSPQDGKYLPLEKDPRKITVDALKATDKKIAGNSSATIYDMGDGAALLTFHSTGMAIDDDLVKMGYKAIEMLENGEFEALVVGHDGRNFCVGANIFMVAMAAQNEMLDQLEESIKALQNLSQAMRYASRPVVIAPFSRTLGGGAEIIMAGTKVVSHIELYAGLVEVGVGLIPAGGGCKELLRRVISPLKEANKNADVLPHLQDIFEAIATAKVSMSAQEAQEVGFLDDSDVIIMNRDYLLGEAKRVALQVADGYVPKTPGKVWAAGRDANAALLLAIDGFREAGYATEYDAYIARKIAYVLTGGGLSEPQWVPEQYIMDLEREVFLSLVTEQKTLDRISHMLQTKKPLRN